MTCVCCCCLQATWEEQEREMRREIEDLKERLSMGQEEFKEKYVECLNLQQQVKKLQRVAGTLSSCVSPLPTVLIDTTTTHTRHLSLLQVLNLAPHLSLLLLPRRLQTTTTHTRHLSLLLLPRRLRKNKQHSHHACPNTLQRMCQAPAASAPQQHSKRQAAAMPTLRWRQSRSCASSASIALRSLCCLLRRRFSSSCDVCSAKSEPCSPVDCASASRSFAASADSLACS